MSDATFTGAILAPGFDALTTSEVVKNFITQQAKSFPPGYKYAFPFDTSDFIKLSVDEVIKTLIEAIILVVIVMFVFLQSWRATLIPTIAVPVVILGTFGILALFGFSINTLTLFGLVLAIGLLVGTIQMLVRWQPDLAALIHPVPLAILLGGIVVLGLLISLLSTALAVRRYLRMNTDELNWT